MRFQDDFLHEVAGSRELLAFASKSVGSAVFSCWNLMLARGFLSIFNSHARRGWFFQLFFSSIFGVMLLVLENGALGPPKTCVLEGFHVKLLFSLEVCLANIVPVLRGDRFFDAILLIRLRVDLWIDQGFYRKRYRKRNRRGFETGKLKCVRILLVRRGKWSIDKN